MGLGGLRELGMDREAWRAAVRGVTKSETRPSAWTDWLTGTSLVAQWLRLHMPKAGGPGLIPHQGTRCYRLRPRVQMLQVKILQDTATKEKKRSHMLQLRPSAAKYRLNFKSYVTQKSALCNFKTSVLIFSLRKLWGQLSVFPWSPFSRLSITSSIRYSPWNRLESLLDPPPISGINSFNLS